MEVKYRILFLGYWNLDDGLTHATIFPHLRILKEMPNIQYLHFANTQREQPTTKSVDQLDNWQVDYTALYSKNLPINHLNKIYDFIHFPKQIVKLCKQYNINLIIARGAPAGSLAYLVWKKINIPFIVESFEPHADYMRAASEWKFFGLRYCFQKYWEHQQKKYAKALVTVAHNYKNKLIEEGVDEAKIHVAPCSVDTRKFFPDKHLRDKMRTKYQIPKHAKVGVYAGKFGGLYLKEEAFAIFKQAFEQINDFYLLLLTNTDAQWLSKQIVRFQLPANRILIHFVTHQEVNSFLNMADFAFALYKSNKVSPFLSPVKIGEYWAVRLPILITSDLGDEYSFIEHEGMGMIYEPTKNLSNLVSIRVNVEKMIEKRKISNVIGTYENILN